MFQSDIHDAAARDCQLGQDGVGVSEGFAPEGTVAQPGVAQQGTIQHFQFGFDTGHASGHHVLLFGGEIRLPVEPQCLVEGGLCLRNVVQIGEHVALCLVHLRLAKDVPRWFRGYALDGHLQRVEGLVVGLEVQVAGCDSHVGRVVLFLQLVELP